MSYFVIFIYLFFVCFFYLYFLFFFFQAEDGIRDADVTGVQTCALPISSMIWSGLTAPLARSPTVMSFTKMKWKPLPSILNTPIPPCCLLTSTILSVRAKH